MGVVALSSLAAPMREAIERAPSGKVVGPVPGPGGWYLLKATGLKRERVLSFHEVRRQILDEITQRKRYVALEKWLDAARQRASVTRP
jgi:parvulin-like peptidyl-prolyl isomerase